MVRCVQNKLKEEKKSEYIALGIAYGDILVSLSLLETGSD